MSMQQAVRQKPASAGRVAVAGGEAVRATISDEACGPRHEIGSTGSALLLAALTRENLQQAFKRVRANKGTAGVDGLDINQTSQHLVMAWPAIREQLLSGTYRPSPVRRVTIPKPDGGEQSQCCRQPGEREQRAGEEERRHHEEVHDELESLHVVKERGDCRAQRCEEQGYEGREHYGKRDAR